MSWKTTLGGALSGLGTSLMGIGFVTQLGGVNSKTMLYTTLAGFIIQAIGGFFTGLFARDNNVTSEQAGAVKPVTSDVTLQP